jgi:histidinol-phosphate aminotransferase
MSNEKNNLSAQIRGELDQMVPYEAGKPIEEIQREYDLDFQPVKLASNENPFSPPPELRNAYQAEFEELNRYPDAGCYYLREKLAEKHNWPVEGIVLGAGSDEILDCLAKAMLCPGSEVLMAQPSFVRYRMEALMMGANPVEVPLDGNLDFDLERMADNITSDTRWICFPNPNNPTARYVNKKELTDFISKIPDSCLLILDEAYLEFMDQPDYPDGVHFLRENLSGGCSIVVLRTFSKAFALAGLRVGYGLMDPQLAAEIHKVRPPFNVTSPSQAVALAALNVDGYLEDVRERIGNERRRLVSELERRGFNVVPPAANFMLVETDTDGGGNLIYEELLKRGVIVRSMVPYNLDRHFRLTVGRPEENDKFLAALDEIGGF